MLLHPDGSEEVLVAGGKGAIADPYVSFDGWSVYYTYFHDVSSRAGADIYLVHVKSRKIVRLTKQEWTPNTGVPGWPAYLAATEDRQLAQRGVYNVHPCPLPGGRVAFVSNRDGFKAPRGAQESLQLFVMDDDGTNVEKIGYLNVAQALHPVILSSAASLQARTWPESSSRRETASGNCVLPPLLLRSPGESSPSRSRIARGTLAVSSERFR
jgi:hypothetical protein